MTALGRDLQRIGLAFALLLALLLPSATSPAADALIRVALLPKSTFDDKVIPPAQLEVAATNALARRGLRVIDLAVATEAQRFAWSDQVQGGGVPQSPDLRKADALYSTQLECNQIADQVVGTALKAVRCALHSKVIRVDSGDVIYTDTRTFVGHGLDRSTALDAIAKKHFAPALDQLTQAWVTRYADTAAWSIDLEVSQLADRALSHKFVTVLEQLPGVGQARLVFFKTGLVKYLLSGKGALNLAEFSAAIEREPRLSLSIVYETPHVLHAAFDLARSFPRPVVVLGVVKDAVGAKDYELPILRASLSVVPYLAMAHASPILVGQSQREQKLVSVRQRAKQLNVPLVLELQLERQSGRWFAASSLHEVSTGRRLLSAASGAPEPEQAITQALQRLNLDYREALRDGALKQALGLPHVESASPEVLVVDAFKLLKQDDADFAHVVLRNTAGQEATNLVARIRSERALVATLALGNIAPGKTVAEQIAVKNLVLPDSGALALEVDYRVGEQYARTTSGLLRADVAEKEREAPDSGPMPEAYRELVGVAARYYNTGDWQEAKKLFLRVHERAPNARTARALGMVEFDLRNFSAARTYLEQALSSGVRPLTPAQRTQVQALLDEADAHK